MSDEPILSKEEMDQIRASVRAKVKEELAAREQEHKADAVKETTARALQEARRQAGLTDYRDDLVSVTIDVAPYADKITVDGKMFFQGHTYQVVRRQADSLREMMARSWDHEDNTGYPNKKFYRRPADTMNPMAHAAYRAEGDIFSYGKGTALSMTSGAVKNAPTVAA
jgi:hypothetical protein